MTNSLPHLKHLLVFVLFLLSPAESTVR